MSASHWRDAAGALASKAPEWMRARASAELHIGGFTQARLETPVLDVADLDDAAASTAITFFLIVAAAGGAAVARVQCKRGAESALVASARANCGPAIRHVDDENAALMRYFDVFLTPPSAIDAPDGARLVAALESALLESSERP